ncbi:MAG: Sodium/calcium exchanger protein-domain-containing protein, partial [Benjaminiella poitrasii]
CSDIESHKDQCAFVRANCQDFSAFYLELYYCLDTYKPICTLILLLCLFMLFGAISVVASDFFCPNLQVISKKLKLSESMVCTSAMDTGAGSLAIGELIGAAFFIVAFVAGSMSIIRPFQAQKVTFKRDATFLTGAIMIITWIVYHQRIYWYHSMLLISYYLCYVLVVVLSATYQSYTLAVEEEAKDVVTNDIHEAVDETSYLLSQSGKNKPTRLTIPEQGFPLSVGSNLSDYEGHSNLGKSIRAISPNNSCYSSSSVYYDTMMPKSASSVVSMSAARPQHRRPMTPRIGVRTSLFGAIEFQEQVNMMRRTNSTQNMLLSPFLNNPRRQISVPQHMWTNYTSPGGECHNHGPHLLSPTHNHFSNTNANNGGRQRTSTTVTCPPTTTAPSITISPSFRIGSTKPSVLVTELLFPSLVGWKEKSLLGKLNAFGAAPLILIFTLTLPVVEEEEESVVIHCDRYNSIASVSLGVSEEELHMEIVQQQGWCKYLLMAQCFFSTMFVFSVLAVNEILSVNVAFISGDIVGCVLAFIVFKSTRSDQPPSWYWMISCFGFFIALNWIFLLANEVVGLLQASTKALGIIFSISEAIMGLTVFAFGNSIGDFVSNTAIAKMGFPTMAISACYAGPLLNMVLGVGISSLYQIWKSDTYYQLDIAPTIVISALGLLTVLMSMLLVVNLNGFRMTKSLGVWMISVYLVCCSINLLLEFDVMRLFF